MVHPSISLPKFDLDTLPSNIVITSAKLSLYGNTGSSTEYHYGDNEANVQRVTEVWTENTVTWDNQPETTTQNQATLPTSTSDYEDYINVDVTDLVEDMYLNPSSSFGFMLRLADETTMRRMAFKSGDSGDAPRYPKLEICYEDHTGINSVTNNLQLFVSPNPFTESFQINYSLNTPTTITIEIFDLVGRIVYSNTVKNAAQGIHKQIINGIESGLYTIVLRTSYDVQTSKVIGLHR